MSPSEFSAPIPPVKAEAGPASFSPCGRFRYTLERVWEPSWPRIAWIGLNPSTADEQALDPTLRRVLAFSNGWGYGRFTMLNLFAYRATRPIEMKLAQDPIGPENDEHIRRVARDSRLVIAAWGTNGGHRGRDEEVVELLRGVGCYVGCLGTTQQGHPRHPLYIKGDTLWRTFR